MTLYDVLKNRTYAHTTVAGTSYSVRRATVASVEGYNGQAAGYRLFVGVTPAGDYTSLDDIEEVCRDMRGPYSSWKYANWH